MKIVKLPPLPRVLQKYQLYFWPAIGILISALLFLLFIMPQIFRIYEDNNKIEEIERRTSQLQAKAQVLNAINLSEYKDYFSKLAIILPPEAEVISAITQIQSVAIVTNVQISEIVTSLPPNNDTGNSFAISLNISGNLQSINEFITRLKSAPRVITIKGIDLSSQKSKSDYLANFNISVYYQKPNTQLTSLEQEIVLLSESEKEKLQLIDQSIKSLPLPLLAASASGVPTGEVGKSNPFE